MSFGKDIFTGLVQTAWDFTVGSSCCKRSMYECLLRQMGIMKPIKFYKLMLVRARLWARTRCCFCCHCCRDEVVNQTLLTMNELPSYAFCIRCRKCLWKPMTCSLLTKGWLHCQISISHHIWPSTPKAETFNAHTHTHLAWPFVGKSRLTKRPFGWWFQTFFVSPLFGEDSHFD